MDNPLPNTKRPKEGEGSWASARWAGPLKGRQALGNRTAGDKERETLEGKEEGGEGRWGGGPPHLPRSRRSS